MRDLLSPTLTTSPPRLLALLVTLSLAQGCGASGADDGSAVGSGGSDSAGTSGNDGRGNSGTGAGGDDAISGAGAATSSGGTGDGGAASGTGGAPTGGGLHPVSCDDSVPVTYLASGLPQLETNPGAPVVLYLDFDGGVYQSSSSGDEALGAYNRNGSPSTFDSVEQADIVRSVTHVGRYYAMFDVNVTTIDAVRQAANGWGWIVISEDISGGSASTSSTAIGPNPKARAKCGAATVRDSDRSRRIAHELGHNFTLHHSGVWVGSTFYKWEDYSGWDHVYGPIMGGGGEGDRNGWALGNHEDSQSQLQDDMEIIRAKVTSLGSDSGWRVDDFADDVPAPLCRGSGTELYRKGVLGSPDDVDVFELVWSGGSVTLEAIVPEVSAVLLDVKLLSGGDTLLGVENTSHLAASGAVDLPAGTYQIVVTSTGEYGALGEYELSIHP